MEAVRRKRAGHRDLPRAELSITVAAVTLAVLLLPTDIGWIRLGMDASTRGTIAAGALTSAAVAGALAGAAWRRSTDRQLTAETAQRQMTELTDRTCHRLLVGATSMHAIVLQRAAKKLGRDRIIDGWSSRDLTMLSRVCHRYAMRLQTSGGELDVGTAAELMLCTAFTGSALEACREDEADSLTLLEGGRQPASGELLLLAKAEFLSSELDRVTSALLIQNASDVATEMLDFRRSVDECCLSATRTVLWSVSLVQVVAAWLTAERDGGDGLPLGGAGFDDRIRALDQQQLAEGVDPEDPTWPLDPEARRRWIRDRRTDGLGVSRGAALSADEELRRRMARAADHDDPDPQP